MMIHALQTDSRELLEAYATQHFRKAVQNTILHHAADELSHQVCEEIEGKVLADAKDLISRLNVDCLRSPRYVNLHIGDAISDVKDQMRRAAARQGWEEQRRAGR